ncbi:MAG: 30S ribosomal protein S12 methylthiotransferase RimO [Clostridia bacterium]|nr:30S ribosomal protein S12 methylthiotransferase RimO [Clostridia bacterium]
MKIGFISLGCSKNLVDTEVMLHHLVEAGYEITPDETEADILIINTCGFIGTAKQESIDTVFEMAELKKEGNLKAILCTGCLAERYRQEILEQLPEVDGILGVGSLSEIVDAVARLERGERNVSVFLDKESAPLGGERVLTTPPYTAYLKVAEGCDNRCTYCAIPLIRGGFRSRTVEDIVKEAKDLEALGVKELNLIAQDTTRYGLDIYGEYALARLVRAICAETSIPWIRLLYCYPDKITDELIAELRDNPRLVKYMDIPIQHFSDPILKAMNRHGNGALIAETVKRLRDAVPDITLRTTAMVGFPGETEEDFEALATFIKDTRFDRFGAFTFSPEEGTEAETMEGQIDEDVKQRRFDALMQLQMDISASLLEEKLGEIVPVLCEGYDAVAKVYFGRSQADAPDVDGKIYFSSKKKLAEGDCVAVEITEALDYDLIGFAVDTAEEN